MVHVGVIFEGFAVSVDMGDEPYTDEQVIAAAREEMKSQIDDAPDGFFEIEDVNDKDEN